MTKLLVQKGLRRIAYFYDDTNTTVNTNRLHGYILGLKEAGIEVDSSLIYSGLVENEQKLEAFRIAMEQQADCLLCCDDHMASTMRWYLSERNISVPDQISIASLYDSTMLKYTLPSVTAVQFDDIEIGSAVCRLLLDYMDGKPVVNRQLHGFQLVVRESTK